MYSIIKTIKKEDVLDILNSSEYQKFGSVPVNYSDVAAKLEMEKAIKIFNVIVGEDVFSQIANRMEGVDADYLLRYSTKIKAGEILSSDDLNWSEALQYCANTEENVSLQVNVKITPIVRREAKKMNLVTDYNVNENKIYVRVKGSGSLQKRILASLQNGDSFFEATTDELTIQTARVYCSMMSKNTSYRTKAVMSGDTTVIFFTSCPDEELICSIKSKIYDLSHQNNDDGLNKIKQYLDRLTVEKLTQKAHTEKYTAWQKYGFPSEQEYIEFVGEESVEYLTKEEFEEAEAELHRLKMEALSYKNLVLTGHNGETITPDTNSEKLQFIEPFFGEDAGDIISNSGTEFDNDDF